MDLTSDFGVDVERQLFEWFHGEFAEWFHQHFPDADGMTWVLLDPAQCMEAFAGWSDPLEWKMLEYFLGDVNDHMKYGGTLDNVEHKLRFVLRTGKPSLMAEVGRPFNHLVLPGDFPYQGAGPYKGYIGGVSGLRKQDDWAVHKMCVDKLIQLQNAVKRAATERSNELRNDKSQPNEVRISAKYLAGLDVSDLFSTHEANDGTSA